MSWYWSDAEDVFLEGYRFQGYKLFVGKRKVFDLVWRYLSRAEPTTYLETQSRIKNEYGELLKIMEENKISFIPSELHNIVNIEPFALFVSSSPMEAVYGPIRSREELMEFLVDYKIGDISRWEITDKKEE